MLKITRLWFWVLYFLSGTLRRKEISIAGTYYSTKYSNAYQLFKEGKVNYWISRDKNIDLENHIYIFSLKSIYIHLISNQIIVDYSIKDVLWFLSKGAKVINAWHGMPIKKIELDIDEGPLAIKFSGAIRHFFTRALFYQDSFFQYDEVHVNSKFHFDLLSNTFKTRKLILQRSPRLKVWGVKIKNPIRPKKIAICLTFNDSGKAPFLLKELLSIDKIDDYKPLIILHPKDYQLYSQLVNHGTKNLELGFDARFYQKGDLLISDQSSLLFDADIAGLETGLLNFGGEELRSQYLDLREYMDPDQVIYNIHDITKLIKLISKGKTKVGWTKKLGFV